MNQKKYRIYSLLWIITIVILSLTKAISQSNIPIGTWRNHLAFNRAQIVHQVKDDIFCISENSLFIFNPEDNGIQIVSKIDGLSDITISAINYQIETELLILGYANGNIDLITDQNIYNLPDVKNVEISHNKSILDIALYEQFIYFITEFGVVVYNQDQNAIKETWQNLSDGGDFLKIMKGTVLNDTIFLATEDGVIAGDLNPGNNLLDYRNWKRFQTDQGLPQENTREIESFNNDLYVVQNDDLIYKYENGYWVRVLEDITGYINSAKSSGSSLTFTLSDRLYYLDESQAIQEVVNDHFLSSRNAILIDNDIWVADFINGLVHLKSSFSEVIRPSGPFSNDVFKIYDFQGNVVAVPSGFNAQYQPLRNPDGFYYFSDGQWMNFNNSGGFGYNPLPDVEDLVDVCYNDIHDKIYLTSFGYGLLEWDGDNTFHVYDDESPGVTLINSNPPEPFTLVPGVEVDNAGKVWMSNYNTNVPLHEFDGSETWQGYSIPAVGSSNIIDFIIATDKNKWMIVYPGSGGGIIVYNEEDGNMRRLTSQVGNGSLPDNNVTSIVEDLEGQIWVGTTNGGAYYPFPFLVFDDPEFEAILPVYENNFLFKDETITSLDVDGGNRKWIGTNKGAWLFGPDGTELVGNFNLVNSPILSDNIIDIEVNQVSGEVFFGTDKGIISFRSDAVEAGDQHSSVKIFPNPVTPNFNGIVGIEGLAQNSIVKITDISGNLVYQTRSEGGMATWNVVDINGQRPNTGIYLVFSSTEDGSDTYVGKLAIIK
jgi:hypothetical protein